MGKIKNECTTTLNSFNTCLHPLSLKDVLQHSFHIHQSHCFLQQHPKFLGRSACKQVNLVKSRINQFTESLSEWMACLLAVLLSHWEKTWFTAWLTYSIYFLTKWEFDWLIRWIIDWLIQWLNCCWLTNHMNERLVSKATVVPHWWRSKTLTFEAAEGQISIVKRQWSCHFNVKLFTLKSPWRKANVPNISFVISLRCKSDP